MTRTRLIKIILSSAAMLAVMIAIFLFSGQKGENSAQMSDAVGTVILEIIGIEVPDGQSASGVPIFAGLTIRNFAHIFLYMLLGVTAFLFTGSVYGIKSRRFKPKTFIISVFAFIICFLYACLDEFHQMFVDGRAATFRDVGFDTLGFTVTIILCALIYFFTAERLAEPERK